MNPTILALDVSSQVIGWVLYDGQARDSGEIALKHGDINHRCRLGRAAIGGLLQLYPALDAVAIEAPGGRFMGTVIVQCFVSGAIRALLAERDLAVCDVSPADCKKALTGKGNASKVDMMCAAWPHYGVRGEHAADALGVALAAVKRISVERQAA